MTRPPFLFAFSRWERVTPGMSEARGACLTCGREFRAAWNELAHEGWFSSDDPRTLYLCPNCVAIVAEEFAA